MNHAPAAKDNGAYRARTRPADTSRSRQDGEHTHPVQENERQVVSAENDHEGGIRTSRAGTRPLRR